MGGRLIADALGQVIENALSFSPPEGRVRVRLTRQIGRVVIVVEDEGPGVPPEWLAHIFERHASFRDAPPPQDFAERGQNFGIGLWVARRNLEAVGGGIAAVNRSGRGFAVSLLMSKAAG
jgi:two-component system sensor histidine kinase ChvG